MNIKNLEVLKMMNILNSKRKVFIVLMLGMTFSHVFAQYSISKHSINSGGAEMSGGTYEMKASIGQIDASNQMSNGNYSVNGGFWHENTDLIFKNGFE